STCTSVCKKVCVGADCNPSNPQCSTCWAWLKNKMGIQQICKIGFFSQIWDSLSCPFYFLKIAILFIASIFGLFFGQKVSARLFKIPLWATWLLGVVFMGIVFTIGWLFLSWYYIIPAIAIVVAGVVIVSMIPGGPALVGRSAGNLAKGYGSYRSSRR
ncbi:MAG: hypothetical protein NT076_02645, partial [Candidatus Pacearchaeota archaeon]|nr:hypothetical protein [Candidatus Pacearchaeota archaeon]